MDNGGRAQGQPLCVCTTNNAGESSEGIERNDEDRDRENKKGRAEVESSPTPLGRAG